jgi:hypothetical protein
MCCKLLGIEALAKPRLAWCQHCKVGEGCGIYDSAERPTECAAFYCAWLVNASLGPEWRPAESKMMISFDAPANRVVVHVDPARGDAWRKAPHYPQIKNMANRALRNQGHLLVLQGRQGFVVLPDREVSLGAVNDDAVIVITHNRTPAGVSYDAAAYAPDDPKLRALGYAG